MGREVGLRNKLDPGEGLVCAAAEQNCCVTLKKNLQRLQGRTGRILAGERVWGSH